MMDWKQYYKEHLMSADEALRLVKSGDRVATTHAAGEPKFLTDALCRRADRGEIEGVKIWQGLNLGDAAYCHEEYAGKLIVDSAFCGTASRAACDAGRGLYAPLNVSIIERAFMEGNIKINGFLANVTPPDENGYVNLGISVDFSSSGMKCADYLIAQVNREMPWIQGQGNSFHVSSFAAFVEHDKTPWEIPAIDDTDPISTRIGEHIAELIPDGACLQMGQGKVPNAILKLLADKKDLGVHTEVFSDNLVPLIEKGIITGARKNIDRGKIVAMFIQGSKDLYRYVNRNDKIWMATGAYTNNPAVIAQNDDVCAINACLEIDLTGQVNCAFQGRRHFSGIGGQLDFLRGAAYSKRGKPIICLPSTAKKGSVSRIVPQFQQGTPVTTPRVDIHWVVTEYGAVNLLGKSTLERAEMLIGIAHPDFRDSLQNEWDAILRSIR
jgi:4-hydroxybutyrate CoA-transferase